METMDKKMEEAKYEGEGESESCYAQIDREYKERFEQLNKSKGWMTEHLVQYQNFWASPGGFKGTLMAQRHFQARPSDIVSVTTPKAGTTWFKAIIVSVMNRAQYEVSPNPLLTTNPHDCVPFIESLVERSSSHLTVINLPSPRLLSSHMLYHALPDSVKSSCCKIVYICRNPKDVLVSQWKYLGKLRDKKLPPLSLEEAFELFREGKSHYGPYWDHALGYWNASLASPNSVLFIHYEDMKMNPLVHVKRLAEFLGHPFSPEEERNGKVHQVAEFCSFDNLSNLEVNKSGVQHMTNFVVENRNFFRKGIVGDWSNHLTEDMARELDRITEERFRGSGLKLPTFAAV